MTVLQALALGLFQGVAEFLPISSSGHLLLLKDLMSLSEVPVLFDVLLHLATLLSIVVVFRKRVAGIIVSCARFVARKHTDADAENLAIVVPALVATVVTGVVGLALDRFDFSGMTKLVSGLLIATGAILVGSSLLPQGSTGYTGLKPRHGLLIGLAQGIGVLPGISRSGITIGGGLAAGLKRQEAGEFAFLLAIPAILGALLLKLKDLDQLSGAVEALPMAVSALAAFAAGVAALLVLMPIVRKGKLAWFAAYLVPAGVLGLLFL